MKLDDYHIQGDKYYYGTGVEVSFELAFLHWRIGAELGNRQCIKNLEWAYSSGIGCEIDKEKAEYWGNMEPKVVDVSSSPGYRVEVSPVLTDFFFSPPEAISGPLPNVNNSRLSIHWLMPDWGEGGGGHKSLFSIIHYLERFGHENTIWITESAINDTAEQAYDNIIRMYGITLSAKVSFISDEFYKQTGNAVMATSWDTAFHASHCSGFNERFYFVQDYEPYFHSRGTNQILAEESYKLGLSCICAGDWLRGLMESKGSWVRDFSFGVDSEYSLIDGLRSESSLLAVYSRAHSPRRCVELVASALEIMAKMGCSFDVIFFGQDGEFIVSDLYRNEQYGVLSVSELCDLYNRATIGVCFSGTNYSIVPAEMMACGLPVVELDTESSRAAFPDGVVEFSGPHPKDIADKISDLLNDPNKRREQSERALRWCRGMTWESAARDVESAILERLRDE